MNKKATEWMKSYLFVRTKSGRQIEKHAVSMCDDKFYEFFFDVSVEEEVQEMWWKLIIDSPAQIIVSDVLLNDSKISTHSVLNYDEQIYLSREVIFRLDAYDRQFRKGVFKLKVWVNQDITYDTFELYYNSSFKRRNETESNQERDVYRITVGTLEKQIEEFKRELKQKDNVLVQKDIELEQKDNELAQKNNELLHEKTEKNAIIRDKDAHIEQLLQVERDFENVKNSKFGRMMYAWWAFKDRLFPQGSKRRLLAKILKKFIRHPFRTLRKCTPRRIKNALYYYKTEGEAGIERRLDECMVNNDIERMKLDIVPMDEKEHAFEEYKMLEFQYEESPLVSIVIPVYNQFNYTYHCLASILKHSQGVSYEVIIADDCSNDLTLRLGEIAKNVTVVTTEQNVRFLLNCNNAAKKARGKYILFLNNDTQVQADWLKTLVDLIESDDSIGMVGSKLVYPDGSLQEAGGIVWKDASAWNYGNRQGPLEPEFNYVKDVDYISGAAIMISSKLWNEIGGFDERFAPAYCEDSDLAFEVRKHGYRVVYQPLSVVVHFEGVSNGTNLDEGLKHYQVVNAKTFKEKWKTELKNHYANAEHVFKARERSRDKKTIVVIDHYVPEYDKDAGSKTTFQYLKMFISKGYNVKFIGDNFYKSEPYTTTLQQMGIEVLYGPRYQKNVLSWLKDNQEDIDFVYMNRPHISEKYIDFIRENTNLKCIYYGHDLHFLRIRREYELSQNPVKLEESEKWMERELYLMRNSDMNYYPSCIEEEAIRQIDSEIPVKAITAYVYEQFREDLEMDFSTKNGILFVGGFGHPPNLDAVQWFLKEVYPKVCEKQKIPFYIVGSNPPDEIKNLKQDEVIVKGFVSEEELTRLYTECKMVVVPLRYGAGVKGKVVEALYNGIPILTTSVGAEGIAEIETVAGIEDEAEAFATQVLSMYNDDALLKEMAEKSQEFVKKHFCLEAVWDVIKEDFE